MGEEQKTPEEAKRRREIAQRRVSLRLLYGMPCAIVAFLSLESLIPVDWDWQWYVTQFSILAGGFVVGSLGLYAFMGGRLGKPFLHFGCWCSRFLGTKRGRTIAVLIFACWSLLTFGPLALLWYDLAPEPGSSQEMEAHVWALKTHFKHGLLLFWIALAILWGLILTGALVHHCRLAELERQKPD